jgi:hypothetical protein
MKKYLPFILVGLGILVLIAVYFLVIKKPAKAPKEEASAQIEVTLNDRPVTSLTPSADGHWLKLKVEKLLASAASMDYELLYELPDGRTQGVPGTITLSGQEKIERDLLLGSESSGKFRYDEGVKVGTLTLRFRNSQGKLLVKFMTKFSLLSKTKELISIDEKFTYSLNKTPTKDFFVVMETFGLPAQAGIPGEIASGPYGVFSSSKLPLAGTVKLEGNIQKATASGWESITDGQSSDLGIFIGL